MTKGKNHAAFAFSQDGTWNACWRTMCGAAAVSACLAAAGATVWAQASSRPCPRERTGEPGPACVTATQDLGRLGPHPVFWHLDSYPTATAANADRDAHGTVVQSLGKTWLFTIAREGWRPARGQRVAQIGPLPLQPETAYTAVYMEAIFDPGMTAAIHSHAGPEAFYTLTGETCLETPAGLVSGHANHQGLVVPGGPPMLLTATGNVRRRSVALILHDSSQPATTMVYDWTPKGLCNR
jgi:hypothetical protein